MNALLDLQAPGEGPPYIPCPGCTRLLYAGEECPVCTAIGRMRALWEERRGRGRFILRSQPKERP